MSMYKIVNGERIEMTEEEIQQLRQEQAAFEAYEKKRPLTQAEVFQIMTKQTLNTLDIDDQTALRMVAYYPTFNEVIGQKVKNGFKFTHDGQLYKTIQPDDFLIQEQYPPGEGTESLYEKIDEVHAGTAEDPIPYSGNMALENGKYYTQDGQTYKCTRDTGTAVYNALSELVGIYVEVVEES